MKRKLNDKQFSLLINAVMGVVIAALLFIVLSIKF
jgi:hypothetical protein